MYCHDARHLLDTGVSPGTSEAIRTLLGFHLAGCAACRGYRRRLEDERLLRALMAQQLADAPRPKGAPLRPAARGVRAAGSAVLVCGALLLSTGLQPAVAAPAKQPAAAKQLPARRAVAPKQAKPLPAARVQSTAYVAMAAVERAAELGVAAGLAPKAELLSAVELVPGQELLIPGLPADAPAGVAAEQAPQRTYVVKSGDTLSGIAFSFYGNAGLWRVIYDANREIIRDPNLIYPNQSFVIPAILGQPPSQPQAGQPPQTGAGGVYVVRSGDTLSDIAFRAYGNAGAWPAIYNANLNVIGGNPHLIFPGQQLQLPR
jgi:nucleoid-associated protein YgaU